MSNAPFRCSVHGTAFLGPDGLCHWSTGPPGPVLPTCPRPLVRDEAGVAEVWRDHVVIDSGALARLLGVDARARVLRVWAEANADFVHLLAEAREPISPGQTTCRGGSTDERVVRTNSVIGPLAALPGLLPQVVQDESGDTYYAEGHHDQAVFALAVVADLVAVGEPDDAAAVLREVGTFLRGVQWVWWRPVPGSDDDEAMERCTATAPGAVPITQVNL